jgi:midasin
MISFNERLTQSIFVERRFGYGCGDINLRDLFRWSQLLAARGDADWDPTFGVDIVYGLRMRRPTDRSQVIELFEAVFGRPPADFTERAGFSISPTTVCVGHATAPRSVALTPNDVAGGELVLPGSMLAYLEALLHGMEHKWVVTVVGPSSSGKSSLAAVAARLTGSKLSTFSMNSSVDTMELLGGFEQIDLARDRQRLFSMTIHLVNTATEAILLQSASGGDGGTSASVAVLWQQTVQVLSSAWGSTDDHPPYDECDKLLVDIGRILPSMEAQVTNVRDDLATLAHAEAHSQSGAFQWRDGLLVDALQQGHWLLVDNVNFCNPSVLDRLNGLLEPGGALVLNERGVSPHATLALISCWYMPNLLCVCVGGHVLTVCLSRVLLTAGIGWRSSDNCAPP